MPGFRDADIYPLGRPDLARARRLAHVGIRQAVMWTCQSPSCLRLAESVKQTLRAIGIGVRIKEIPASAIFEREFTPGARYDIAWFGWEADYADPSTFIGGPASAFPSSLLGTRGRRIARESISGPARLRAFGRLDIDLARRAAPAIAFADLTAQDFFSARIGCQTYQPIYGMDLAALCTRRP